jgi:glycerol-3-phosphate dehydrogenase
MSSAPAPLVYDLAIIGGGINGCGIARDAAGRGWSVFLCEAGDLASATSSASTKLIHGGLRYLEYFDFRLVREALAEREILWSIAPHIIWPLRFVLPHRRGLRPAWRLRLGLFLYDHIGGRKRLPATRTLNLRRDSAGRTLKPEYRLAFEYSDCWADDARLVILNALDASERGATIATHTRCLDARRAGDHWRIMLRNERTPERQEISARALVNAAGPWVGEIMSEVLHLPAPAPIRLVQGSHVVVPRLYPEEHCYVFQNADKRILFVIPYERDYTLIGTTDRDYHGDPARAEASAEEIAYLCEAASQYFGKSVTPERVVWSYSGVRPLYDDGASEAQAATRDFVLHLDAPGGQPAVLSIFGGKLTTYRRLAERALAQLAPYLPRASGRAAGWTGLEPLPGGDFPVDGFDLELQALGARYPFLGAPARRRLLRAYGTRASELLGGATSAAELGRGFGADLTEAEVRYLVRREWATSARDILWRRGKLGLRFTPDEVAALDAFIKGFLALGDVAARA